MKVTIWFWGHLPAVKSELLWLWVQCGSLWSFILIRFPNLFICSPVGIAWCSQVSVDIANYGAIKKNEKVTRKSVIHKAKAVLPSGDHSVLTITCFWVSSRLFRHLRKHSGTDKRQYDPLWQWRRRRRGGVSAGGEEDERLEGVGGVNENCIRI